MARFRSPGQRRRRNIKLFFVFCVLAITAAAWFVPGPGQLVARAAVRDPGTVAIAATVQGLEQREEQYRNFKGRRRTRTNYYATLTYELNGDTVTKTREIDSEQFHRFTEGDTVELWGIGPNHDLIRLKEDVLADANMSPMARSMSAAFTSGIACFVLAFITLPIFGREPNGYLPEGFYNDSNWLDVEDGQLIAIHDNQLLRFKFNDSQVGKVQSLYQANQPLEDIIALKGKGNKLVAVPLQRIIGVSSDHYEDTYTIRYETRDEKSGEEEEKSLTLEFLNPTVKAHAMEALAARLAEYREMSKEVVHLTRLQSTLPGLVCLLLGGLGVWYFDNIILLLLCALFALMGAKSFVARLWSPTVTTRYAAKLPEAQAVPA